MMRVGAIFNYTAVVKGFCFKRKKVLFNQAQSFVKAGAEHIEIDTDILHLKPYKKGYLQREINALLPLKGENITFSLHAPILGIITGINYPLIRKACVKTIINHYQLLSKLEPTTITIHPEALSSVMHHLDAISPKTKKYLLDLIRKYEVESFEELTKVIPAEKICIENFHYGELAEYKKIIKKYDIGVTYDIGHYLLQNYGPCARKRVKKSAQLPFGTVEAVDCQSIPDPREYVDPFFNEWKGMVRNIHLHNVRERRSQFSNNLRIFVDHKALNHPDGVINIEKACQRFQKFGYNGTIIIEEPHNKKITESIRYLRQILEKIQANA